MASGFALETAWARRRNKKQGYYAYLVKNDADATAVTVWQAFLFPAVGGAGDMVGTAAITFTPAATIAGAGALAGTSALVFSPSATLAGAGALAGSSSATFAPSGTLGGQGALTGATNLSFVPSGALVGAGAMVGTSALAFAPLGTLAGLGGLIGTAAVTFTLSATADIPPEPSYIYGAASFGFTLSGTVRNFQYLHPIIITTTASIVDLDPSIPATIAPIPVPPGEILPLA